MEVTLRRGRTLCGGDSVMLRCGATFQWSWQQHSSSSSTCSSAHLHFISQTVLGICENRAWGWSTTSGIFLFKAGFSMDNFGTGWWLGQRGTSVPGCCTVWKAETNPALSSLPPTAPAGPWKTAGRHWVVGKAAGPSCGPREKEGLWYQHGQGGISVKCRQGLTLPLDLLHAGASPQDSCHPSVPLGCALGHTFSLLCFSVT